MQHIDAEQANYYPHDLTISLSTNSQTFAQTSPTAKTAKREQH